MDNVLYCFLPCLFSHIFTMIKSTFHQGCGADPGTVRIRIQCAKFDTSKTKNIYLINFFMIYICDHIWSKKKGIHYQFFFCKQVQSRSDQVRVCSAILVTTDTEEKMMYIHTYICTSFLLMLFVNDWVDCVQRLDLYSHLHNSHTSLLHGREGAESERERKRGRKRPN